MSFRLPPTNLYCNMISGCGTVHTASIVVPIEDAIKSEHLFHNVRPNLMAGDLVTIMQFDMLDNGSRQQRLIAEVSLRIEYAGFDKVEWRQRGEIEYFDARREIVKAPGERPASLPSLSVDSNPDGEGFVVVDDAGFTHKHFPTKRAAARYVADFGKKEAA